MDDKSAMIGHEGPHFSVVEDRHFPLLLLLAGKARVLASNLKTELVGEARRDLEGLDMFQCIFGAEPIMWFGPIGSSMAVSLTANQFIVSR